MRTIRREDVLAAPLVPLPGEEAACVKCGATESTRSWSASCGDPECRRSTCPPEHIVARCLRCRFEWPERCRDETPRSRS